MQQRDAKVRALNLKDDLANKSAIGSSLDNLGGAGMGGLFHNHGDVWLSGFPGYLVAATLHDS